MFMQMSSVGLLACCVTVANAQPVTVEPAAEAPREAPEAPREAPEAPPPPRSVEATTDRATTSPRGCKVRLFLEPSLHVVALSYTDRPYFLRQHRIAGSTVIGRFRGGVHLDGCTGRADVRAAASLMVTNMPNLGDQYFNSVWFNRAGLSDDSTPFGLPARAYRPRPGTGAET
jgi:hypothetical protein